MIFLKVVPQASEYVIEFLGKYQKTWQAGLHFMFPGIQKIAKKVVLKEQVLDSPPQSVITKDNVTVNVDAVIYFKVFDSKLFAYGAANPILALENLAATTLRNIIGSLDLEETLVSRDQINTQMETILDQATDFWGIKVTRVELKNIILPADIRDAMEKQLKAEREKRATILEAEAHQESVKKRAEGDKMAAILQAEGERDAKIARAEGEAKALFLRQQAEAGAIKMLKEAGADNAVLELKRFEAMEKVANGTAVKIIVPTNMTNMISSIVAMNETAGVGDVTAEGQKALPEKKSDPCSDDKGGNGMGA